MNWGALVAAYLPRILGVGAAFITTKLTEKTGIIVDPASLIPVGLGAYGIVHRLASSKWNKGDAANVRMVVADKEAAATGTAVVPAPPTGGVNLHGRR